MARRSRNKPPVPASADDMPVRAGTPVLSGQALADLKRARAEAARQQAEQAERERLARAARERESALLRDAFEGVQPLLGHDRAERRRPRPVPLPVQRERDEQQALRSTMSDEIVIERYLDIDDSISYSAPGIGADVLPRLRRGHWAVGAQIDLHGFRTDEARDALMTFLDDCRRRTLRCVRVIHGKGLGSANRQPVLKGKVRRWLAQRQDVLAFCQARPTDGGAGALLVLLSGPRR
ncbi:MAG: Smr/MutS family protein [Burkholderiaceae bacterium]